MFQRSFSLFVQYFRRHFVMCLFANIERRYNQGLPLGELEGNKENFPSWVGKRDCGCLPLVDNSFLKTPLKSEWNMPFWVAPAGNNGTSEKVALFFSIECSKRKFMFHFSKPSFISLPDCLSRHFFGNGNRSL